MNPQKSEVLLFDGISVLEWYDGVVRGIGTHQGKYYLIVLVAWAADDRRRAFVVLSLDRNIGDEMTRLTRENDKEDQVRKWDEFNRLFDTYVSTYNRDAYLLLKEPGEQTELSVVPISADCLGRLVPYNVENTLSVTATAFWFNIS